MTQSDIINNNFSKAFECIKCSNAYDTGEVLSEEKLFKQISERKHSTFDLSKFTVVGSPTITDDGVASGFSDKNYLTLNSSDLMGSNNYSINLNFTFTSSLTTSEYDYIMSDSNGSQYGISIYRLYNIIYARCNSNNNLVALATSVSLNTPYNVEINVANGICSIDTTVNQQTSTKTLDISAIQEWSNVIWLGNRFGDLISSRFKGSIDLKQFSITVDGKEVFSGNKTGIDVINDVEIPYTLSKTGSKIVDVAYRDRVIDLYEQQGLAGYYTIDEENKNFTLPMGEVYGMIENKASKKEIYNKLTNCLLEVPQRIKLELNNGALTLKAGSKVIVPNGFEADGTTPKFDYVTIGSDVIFNTTTYATNNYSVFYNKDLNIVDMSWTSGQTSSGSSPSYGTSTYLYWYDTANNKLKRTDDTGATWTEGYSLPIGLCSYTIQTGVTSIDQVFNGIGYIGSTVWVDKGVKGLIPNGRNEDGSLKNIEITINKIVSNTLTYGAQDYYLSLEYGTPIFTAKNVTKYDSDKNVIIDTYANKDRLWCFAGECTADVNNKITSFQPKLPFRAVDYNDKLEISSWGMPSNKYIDLTLGASGSTYTAPANGYIYFNQQLNSGMGIWVDVFDSNNNYLYSNSITSAVTTGAGITIPIKKNYKYTVNYTGGTKNHFRFVYAEGSK